MSFRYDSEVAWTVLAGLLAALLVGSLIYDRSDWQDDVSGEATTLMQAASLAHDFDLVYSRSDFDRYLLLWNHDPHDLRLSSTDGRRIAFDKPFAHAVWLAPFLRLWPRSGFAVANAVLLALVGLFAARILDRTAGTAGVWAVTVLIFASVTFGYVFLATDDLFLFAVAVVAFGLAVRTHEPCLGQDRERGRRRKIGRRWLAAGALLAILVASEPLDVVLLIAAFFAVPAEHSAAARRGLLTGAVAGLLALVVVQWWAGGGLHFLATTRFRFATETGFPLVDFSAGEWPLTLRHLQATHWEEAPRFGWGVSGSLWLWDGIYLLLGRSIGLLPYFAPLLLLGFSGSLLEYRRPLVIAALAWAAAIVVLHPFDLFGGEGSIGNRLFLPIFGALFWTLDRYRRPLVGSIVALAVAALFLGRLWLAPWASPVVPGGGFSYLTPPAEWLLPFETSQRWIPAGVTVDADGLWVRFLDQNAWDESRRRRLVLDGRAPAELLVASSERLSHLRLEFGAEAPAKLEVGGMGMAEQVLHPDGRITYRLAPRWPVRRHPMWWTPRPQWLYRVSLELPTATKPVGFVLSGESSGGS